jgi:outer membrane protein assembly factor BamE (lipoprotein component of BamABCDE complex)
MQTTGCAVKHRRRTGQGDCPERLIQMTDRRSKFPPRPLIALALAAFIGTGCASEVNLRGNAPDLEQLAVIKPGAQSREQVIQLLGSPTSVGTFDKSVIYYISQRIQTVTYHAPKVLSRQVVEITFDKSDRVAAVKTYDLKDGKKVKVVERTTPTPGRQFTLIQQLLGNLGRFENPNKGPDLSGKTTP